MVAEAHVVASPSNPHMSKSDAMYSDMLKELLTRAHQQLVNVHTKAVSILKADYEAQLQRLRCELETLRKQSWGGGATKSTKEAGTSDEDGSTTVSPKSVHSQGSHEVWKDVKSEEMNMKAMKSMRSMGSESSLKSVKSVSFARGRNNSEEKIETSDGERSGSSFAQGGAPGLQVAKEVLAAAAVSRLKGAKAVTEAVHTAERRFDPWLARAVTLAEMLSCHAHKQLNYTQLKWHWDCLTPQKKAAGPEAKVFKPTVKAAQDHQKVRLIVKEAETRQGQSKDSLVRKKRQGLSKDSLFGKLTEDELSEVSTHDSDFGLAGSAAFSFSEAASVPAPVSADSQMQAMTKQLAITGAKTTASEFKDMDDKQCRPPPAKLAPLRVEVLKTGWHIRNVCQQQALKIGLSKLNTRLEVLNEPAETMGKQKDLNIKRTLLGICSRKVDLNQLNSNVVLSCQDDVPKLTLAQLLLLTVMYPDPKPGARGEFLRCVENVLYEKLGRWATSTDEVKFKTSDVGEVRRLGKEAVLLIAANAAIPASPVWVWFAQENRTFFNTQTFSLEAAFPKQGVMEFSDYSALDTFSGGELNWQIRHIKAKQDLKSVGETSCKDTVTPDVSAGSVVQCQASLKSVNPLTRCDELVREFRFQLKGLQLRKQHEEYKHLVLTEFDEVLSMLPRRPEAPTTLTEQEYWKKYGTMHKTPLWLAVTRKYHAGTGDPMSKSDEFLHAMSMITGLWVEDPKPIGAPAAK